jgi:hypothetical protein
MATVYHVWLAGQRKDQPLINTQILLTFPPQDGTRLPTIRSRRPMMKRTAVLTALLGIALLTAALSVSTASATVLCKTATNPCTGGGYGKGAAIEANLKSGTEVYFGSWCSKSSIKGEVTNAGSEGTKVAGTISALSFSECESPITILKKGTFTLQYLSGNNGILTLEGFEITASPGGAHCVYSGSAQIFLKGGTPASINASAEISPPKGCEDFLMLRGGAYVVTAPSPLYISEYARASTVLCKTATSPCSGESYKSGTAIEASTKGKSVLDAPFGNVECEGSIKGAVTGVDSESNVVGTVSSWNLKNCGEDTVQVLETGTFTIKSSSSGNGTLILEGFKTTVVHLGIHCIYSGSATFSLKGGTMASLSPTGNLSRTGGGGGFFCGASAPLTGEYTVTAPEPLYVEPGPSIYPVLCKTATNPCAGGAHAKGTTIEGVLQNGLIINAYAGDIECRDSSLKGEVTSSGEGSRISIAISTLSFSNCNGTFHVLVPGKLEIDAPSKGNGTLWQDGSRITTVFLGFHCIFETGMTHIGSIRGGQIGSLVINSTVPRVGGTSGVFCGSSAPWAAEYVITAPSPLYVEES